jgi:predicted dehydrogenase
VAPRRRLDTAMQDRILAQHAMGTQIGNPCSPASRDRGRCLLSSTESAPLRLGLAGFGRLARSYYVPALRRMQGVRVSAIADPLPASRAAARAAFGGAPVGAGFGELLDHALDAVLVASPPSTHLDLWDAVAAAGLPVFMEKPFVVRGQLPRVLAGGRERRLLMLDLNRRFWPPYRSIRDAVQSGAIGEVESVRVELQVDIRPWCTVTSHRLQAAEGGVLYDLGSQALDLACWIAGREASSVRAFCDSCGSAGDRIRLELSLRGGGLARCDLAYADHTFERVTVDGRLGRLWLSDPNMTVHQGPRNARASALDRARDLVAFGYRGLRRSRSMSRYSISAALESFVDCIRRGLPFAPGFDHAVMNASLLEAAVDSMAPSASGLNDA